MSVPSVRSLGPIKILDASDVEFICLRDTATVTERYFRAGLGHLLTLLDDNSLHLWSLKVKGGVSELQEDETFTLRGPPG